MIRLENVTKVYDGGIEAVQGADFEIAKGEFVFLVGPSGSGKSTIIRLVLREERPTSGDLWVAGKHASAMPNWKVPQLRRSIGTVFQDFKLLPNKTVYENVSFALEVTGRPRSVARTQVPQVLKLVGLSEKADRYPRTLSGGEQQRVSVARAFVNRPLILLADEPTGNLDPATSVGIMRILDRINRTGTTVVMATHDHAIVDAMRRRVVQLDAGHIVRDQTRGVYERAVVIGNQPESSSTPTVDDTAPAVDTTPVEATDQVDDETVSVTQPDTIAPPEAETGANGATPTTEVEIGTALVITADDVDEAAADEAVADSPAETEADETEDEQRVAAEGAGDSAAGAETEDQAVHVSDVEAEGS
jgi:cell division transport system ATP-binding protein